jgi:hypothetical protein
MNDWFLKENFLPPGVLLQIIEPGVRSGSKNRFLAYMVKSGVFL